MLFRDRHKLRKLCQSLGSALVAIALASASSPVAAQNADEQASRLAFEAADTDGDGRLSEAEVAMDTAAAFAAEDDNGDDHLQPDELQEAGPGDFQALDENNDGKVSFPEVMRDKVEDFEAADSDKDGSLTYEEVRQYESQQ